MKAQVVSAHADGFREALARWASGVTVVTFDDGAAVRGLTVSSFTSVSLEPPLILVCIREDSRFLRPLLQVDRFSVNLLAHDQSHVSRSFAGRQSPPPPFLNGGVPILPGALVTLGCRIWKTYRGGDHRIVVGQVEQTIFGAESPPLVYYQREYTSVAEEAALLVRVGGGGSAGD